MREIWSSIAAPLSRSGLGLLMWSGMTTAVLHLRPGGLSTLQTLQRAGLLTGIGLLVLGSLASWRLAGGASRTSRPMWIATSASCLIAAALWLILGTDVRTAMPMLPVASGVLLVLAAFGAVTVAAAAHGTGNAPTAWRHPLVLPVHLLLAMTAGLALLYVLMDRLFVSPADGRTMLATLAGLGACLALCKGVYWRAIGGQGAWRRRGGVALLLAGGPLLAWGLVLTGLPARMPLMIAVATLLAAAVWEHHLFLVDGAAVPAPTTPIS